MSQHPDDAHHHDGADDDEYTTLLNYVAKVAEKKPLAAGVNSDGSYEKKHRLWYAPWKTKTVKYDRQGDVIPADTAKVTPEDWSVAAAILSDTFSADDV